MPVLCRDARSGRGADGSPSAEADGFVLTARFPLHQSETWRAGPRRRLNLSSRRPWSAPTEKRLFDSGWPRSSQGDQKSCRVVAFLPPLLLPRSFGQALPRGCGAGRDVHMLGSTPSGLPCFPLLRCRAPWAPSDVTGTGPGVLRIKTTEHSDPIIVLIASSYPRFLLGVWAMLRGTSASPEEKQPV